MKNLKKNIQFLLLIAISAISLHNQSDAKVEILNNDAMVETLPNDQLKVLDTKTEQNTLPLHEIIRNRNISIQEKIRLMQSLLDHEGVNINEEDADGRTALVLATFFNADPIIVKFLIDHGAKVNQPDRFNETPLHNAVRHEEIESAELLLKAKADPALKNDTLETPIDLARSPNTTALFGRD